MKERYLDHDQVLCGQKMKAVKEAERMIKTRRRKEKKLSNLRKFDRTKRVPVAEPMTKTKKVHQQIENGFKIAKKWKKEGEKNDKSINNM